MIDGLGLGYSACSDKKQQQWLTRAEIAACFAFPIQYHCVGTFDSFRRFVLVFCINTHQRTQVEG